MIAAVLFADVAPANAPAVVASSAPENRIFFELLGNGLLYSINYERFFPRWNVGLRAGASYFAYGISDARGSGDLKLATFPLTASWLWGTPHHKLELGLGATILYVSASTDSTGTQFQGEVSGLGIAATAIVGYRYVPLERGFTFGAGFTPLVRANKGFLPWGGVNAGYAF